MPGKVKVKVIAGRNLPVMDRSSDTTDAYVEIKLGSITYKTDVCRKSLHPQWNSEWYRFEVDDSELQDEPLQMRLMDHDTYSANDAIGKIYFDLNPLLLPPVTGPKHGNNDSNTHDKATNTVLSGWIPVYDTMHGIRGEVNVIVKVELFSDFNRYRQSSCGVQFFYSPTIPHGYYARAIYGFVEELVVNDDPEYQWIDKIRTPRASNEARQTLFFKLSGELQRKIGVKALELGANSVIGYKQCFDLEGESGIVARGIGTAAFLVKITHENSLESEEIHLNYSNVHSTANSLCLNVEPFNYLPNHLRNSPMITQSKIKPVSFVKGSSMKGLSIEDSKKNSVTSLKQRVKNFMSDKDSSSRFYLNVPKRKLFAKRPDRPSVMAEMLIRSVYDTDLSPVLETLSSDQSESSISGKCLESQLFNPTDSLECSLSSDSSSDEETSVSRSNIVVDDTISDILRVLEPEKSRKYLKKQYSFSLTDLNSEFQNNSVNRPTKREVTPEFISKAKSSSEIYARSDQNLSPETQSNTNVSEESEEINVSQYTHSPIDFNSSKDPKLILPPIEIHGNIEKQSLFNTAMQTILLEKANIVGTYTPPISPVELYENKSSSSKPNKCFTFKSYDHLNKPIEKFKTRKIKETVLGIPFQSISTTTLSKNSSKNLFLSEKILNRPITDLNLFENETQNVKRNFKGSIMNKFQHSGLKRLSLFDRPPEKILEHQRSLSSNDLRSNKFKSHLLKSNSLMKILSRFHLFKNKERKENLNLRESIFHGVANDTRISENPTEIASSTLIPPDLTSNVSSSSNNVESELARSPNNQHACSTLSVRYNSSPLPDSFHADHHRSESVGTKISQSPAKLANVACIHRRSSDSDLSITPKGNSLTGSDRSGYGGTSSKRGLMLRSGVQQDNFDMLDYPFLTIDKYPPGFILYLGGTVSARSVKLLERISNIDEPETRDTWWSELRMEIRSHARALNCNAVLGYSETCSICEDVCVLSASGTAAVIGFSNSKEVEKEERQESDKDKENFVSQSDAEQELNMKFSNETSCMICHLPYSSNMQIRSNTLKCAVCRKGKVPEVLITTIEIPDKISIVGRGCLIQASVHRPLKELRGESNAKEISEGLPFLEYELHRILLNKLKIKGMNAIFCLKVRISIGEKMLIGVATGTAMFLAPLHSPAIPKLISDRTVDDKKLTDLQKRLNDTVSKNREIYRLKNVEETQISGRVITDDDSDDEKTTSELSYGNKDCCLLEVDDPDDVEILNLLMEECPPNGIHVVNTEAVPGLEDLEIVKNLQMFKQIYRSKIQNPFSLNQHCQKLLQCIYFKLRRMVPCSVCDLQFRVDVPDADEIQISVLGMVLGLGNLQKTKMKRKNFGAKNEELIFNLEEVNIPENSVVNTPHADSGAKNRQKSPLRVKEKTPEQRHKPYKERHGVDITPLSYMPGGKIERYLGNLNFFFIRETTSIREEGGASGFVHSFATEVLAIVRAHVSALGGNGMVSYFMTECVLNYNIHKNQGQCLVNVGGDVVFVSYYKDE